MGFPPVREAQSLPLLLDPALLDKVGLDASEVERPWNAQRPRERLSALREFEACQVGMQVRPPTWHAMTNIRPEFTVNSHHTHQVGPRRPGTTPYAGADRLRTARHDESIP